MVSCYECSRVHTFGGFQTYQWILAVAAALCLGMSKTGFVGLNLLGIALMASVWPARESTGVILPMLVFGDFFGVAAFHRHALWPEIWRVLPPALAGVVIGFGIFHILPAPLFAPIIGWTILVLLALQILQRSTAAARSLARLSGENAAAGPGNKLQRGFARPWLAWSIGVLVGVATMLANAAGPIMTIYLLAARLPKYEFMGTTAYLFLTVNLSKLPFSYSLGLITLRTLHFNLILLPAVAIGALTGRQLLKFVPQLWFERLLLLSAGLAALRLIWR